VDDDITNDIPGYESSLNDDDGTGINEEVTGNSNNDSAILKSLVDFKQQTYRYKQTLRGFQEIGNKWVKTQYPIAGDSFIAKSYGNLNAIMSEGSIMVDGDETMLYNMLVENILNLIRVAYDDPSIYENDFTQVYLMYSNCLEVWLQCVDGGRGKEDVKQIMIGVYKYLEDKDTTDMGMFGQMAKSQNRMRLR
jgi:hypothetical protein